MPKDDAILTAADVRWGYTYYLGREISAPEMQAREGEIGAHTVRRFAEGLFASAEARRATVFPVEREFAVLRPGARKVVVIGSCHAPNIGRALAAMGRFSIYAFEAEGWEGRRERILAELEDADLVVAARLASWVGFLSEANLRQVMPGKLVFYSLPRYRGLHPDMTYYALETGSGRIRLPSPVGEYHSSLVLDSFLGELSPEACAARFGEAGFEEAGCFAVAEASRNLFVEREQGCDIRIAEWFFSRLPYVPLLYTFNHPTAEVFVRFAAEVCRILGERPCPLDGSLVMNGLAQDVIWPIHPEFARSHQLRYGTHSVFWKAGVMMDLQEFIHRSYILYGAFGRDALRSATAAPY